MAPNISQVFYKEDLIAENSLLSLNILQKELLIIDNKDRESIYSSENVHSLEWCFHESGPLGSSKFEAFVVLQFASSQRIFDHQIDPFEPVVLVVGTAFVNFLSVQLLVIKYQRVFTPNVVKLLPFSQFPDSVKRVLPSIVHSLRRRLQEKMKDKEEKEKPQSDPSNDTTCIQIDDEDRPETSEVYYDIDGARMQITNGIASLADGEYMNDEAINAAFLKIQKQFPTAHVFDTLTTGKILDAFEHRPWETSCTAAEDEYNRHFGNMFLKKSSFESRPIHETFFAKKMLIFPINHINHWYLVMVVNPLLSDIKYFINRETKGHKAAAYYVDSLTGTAKYPHELMVFRLALTWKCIFAFLRLGALFHFNIYLQPKLISCNYETNIPSQENTYDCGPHTVINARLMANRFDELAKGPELVVISPEEEDKVLTEVRTFRKTFKAYLERCRVKPS